MIPQTQEQTRTHVSKRSLDMERSKMRTPFLLQDGVNRMKKAMRWQDRRIHMKVPNFGEPT
jgi:hypothetical protein